MVCQDKGGSSTVSPKETCSSWGSFQTAVDNSSQSCWDGGIQERAVCPPRTPPCPVQPYPDSCTAFQGHLGCVHRMAAAATRVHPRGTEPGASSYSSRAGVSPPACLFSLQRPWR